MGNVVSARSQEDPVAMGVGSTYNKDMEDDFVIVKGGGNGRRTPRDARCPNRDSVQNSSL